MNTTLQDILKETDIDGIPQLWHPQGKTFKQFSRDKNLFRFQQDALTNAIKTLWLYYTHDFGHENEKPGEYLESLYRFRDSNATKIINKFGTNRMGFWMATGSGKTLVIVKLIELISLLMKRKRIPERDIMFLVYRENLLNQFKAHVEEYNASGFGKVINLIDLQEYGQIKNENVTPFFDTVNVFYYRADLFVEKQSTAKKINPASCDNNGNWYVLLDEAHKGDSGDSKLQQIYSDFARNGFLFNFSATFVDEVDLVTCAYNFNLEKFIESGFGKKICVLGKDVLGFRKRNGIFQEEDKQKIVLKSLILHTYIKQHLQKIRKHNNDLYHNPLLLSIVNTVTDKGSDLRMFFSEIEKIARGNIRSNLFASARAELVEEGKRWCYIFDNQNINIDDKALSKIEYEHVLKAVFNTTRQGTIEVIRVPGNSQEIVFKMQTSSEPFALIRIGSISAWVREILANYEFTERYDDESIFNKINEDSSNINILMGSRAFYEGWDSNRPNIILFINIGVKKDSKKFILQAIGRGVRIEPVKNQRRRLRSLVSGEIDHELAARIKKDFLPLETLFVFGTDAANLKEVTISLKREQSFPLGNEFIINPNAKNKQLLIPTYIKSEELISDEQQKYPISKDDLRETKNFFNALSDKIMLVKYDCSPQVLRITREKLGEMKHDKKANSIRNPEFLAGRLLDYYNLRNWKFDKFNELTDQDIVHFKHITFRKSPRHNEIREKIQKVLLEKKQSSFIFDSGATLDIKYLTNHYYHPLIASSKDKIEYLTHIIDVESNVKFIKELEAGISILNKKFRWWMFSKLDKNLDKIYIPYYNWAQNRYDRFHPDFIFWLENKKGYHILFINPKGTERTSYQHKVEGYEKFFGAAGREKILREHGKDIRVYLRFFGGDKSKVPKPYKNYWINSISEISKILDGRN